MKILFLGTGGGRINLVKQFRSTAGFLIQGAKNIYVDPGPGVLFQAKRFHFSPKKINMIFVSHPHLDHANDAELLIEAMTYATLRKRGTVIADASVLQGSRIRERAAAVIADIVSAFTPFKMTKETYEPAISAYHKRLVNDVYEIWPGRVVTVGGATFVGTKTMHDCSSTGFVLVMDGKRIGYTADTEYFDGLAEQFVSCDVIIINILRAAGPWKGHFNPENVIKFLKIAKPKIALLTRFGGQYFETNPNGVAKGIQEASGVETIATYDGLSFEV
jgi:ribonuclease BN (tRNA processing enzyme)